jgi:2-amino-4-hydroxy-6-hydroxymethyldihydropteridine diphosphokinase
MPGERGDASSANMAEALLGLGGNLGDARTTIARAIALLADGRNVRLLARSGDYRTPPWGDPDQPDFINTCIAVSTELSARQLLRRALAVERVLGRRRAGARRWGPRTIDVDLIAYADLRIEEPDLVLPHPRLFERAFVLVPLAEIAPERVIAGMRIADARARIDARGITRLPD